SRAALRAAAGNANRYRRHARVKPCPRLEHTDHAADRRLRGWLAQGGEITIDQPVAETKRSKRKYLAPIANGHSSEQSAIRRTKFPGRRRDPQEHFSRAH